MSLFQPNVGLDMCRDSIISLTLNFIIDLGRSNIFISFFTVFEKFPCTYELVVICPPESFIVVCI